MSSTSLSKMDANGAGPSSRLRADREVADRRASKLPRKGGWKNRWKYYARSAIDGTGVRLTYLLILFLSFVVMTEWIRDRESVSMGAFTPRLVRARYMDASGKGASLTSRSGTYAYSVDDKEDSNATVTLPMSGDNIRTYMDHGVVRLEAEVCGSTSMMALTVFAVCASIGLNDIAWTASKSRRQVSLTVMYITIVACYTHYLMVQGSDLLLRSVDGTYYSLLRYLEWMFTTPVLLILVYQLHALSLVGTKQARLRSEMWTAVIADEIMLVTGMWIHEVAGSGRGFLLAISMGCFTYIIGKCIKLFSEILDSDLTKGDRTRFVILAVAKTVCWTSFPIVFVAKEAGLIDSNAEHEWFLSCDVLTKAVYCLLLSAGNIRILDVHRAEEMADIERLTTMQRDFFFNITHELRMPLNSVIGFNTLAVESGELTDVADGFIKNSLTSAEALLGLINQVLDYAKFNRKGAEISGGHGLELSNDTFTLEELLDQTLSISQRQDYTGEVFIRVDPSLFPMTYTSDFFRLRQCLVNLVNNAVKFSSNLDRSGRVVIDVRGYLDSETAHLTFCVEDNGVGIPEERQNAVFIPFSQQSDYSALRVQGTGLGLTITKTIIELMGGDISFTSKEDVGTTFNVTIPIPYRPNEKNPSPPQLTVLVGLKLGLQKRTVRNILACYQLNPNDIVEVSLKDENRTQLVHYITHAKKSDTAAVLIIEEEQYFENETFLNELYPPPQILIVSKSSRMKDLPHTSSIRAIMKPIAMSTFLETLKYLAENARLIDDGTNVSTAGMVNVPSPQSSASLQDHRDEMHIKSTATSSRATSEDGGVGQQHWASKKTSESNQEADISHMNVLIVEDNRLNQQVAIHSLKKCGVSIDVAENGLIAVQKIEETIKGTLKPYDIIFMDILMPVMDGNEATRKIRELERKASNNYKRNLIVALSANVGPEHTLSVKEAGCDGSLGKPFYPSTLRQLVYAVHSGEYQGFESKDPQAAIRPGH